MRVQHLPGSRAAPTHLGGAVRCYTCDGVGAVSGRDPVADRAAWPTISCLFTPGCAGLVEPEALN
ncbi:MAG: hypothetical protein QOI63_1332 [Thermoplasmata archaeon]|jgi:hypothetical protein|nr:hypothetical protein [Thermoplasmata archaeon]